MHCITTMINLVNLAAYLAVSFSPLIRLDSDTDMTFHCSLSLRTISSMKQKSSNYLPILRLKCQLLDIYLFAYRSVIWKYYFPHNCAVVLNTITAIITCGTQPEVESQRCWCSWHSLLSDIAWISKTTIIKDFLEEVYPYFTEYIQTIRDLFPSHGHEDMGHKGCKEAVKLSRRTRFLKIYNYNIRGTGTQEESIE